MHVCTRDTSIDLLHKEKKCLIRNCVAKPCFWGAMMLPQAVVIVGAMVNGVDNRNGGDGNLLAPSESTGKIPGQDREYPLYDYMPELTIAGRAGKTYHEATCEHVTDRAVHPVGEVRKFKACRECLPEAYTVESVTNMKPRCFFCLGITAFMAGTWTGVMFSFYGVYWTGSGAAVLNDVNGCSTEIVVLAHKIYVSMSGFCVGRFM